MFPSAQVSSAGLALLAFMLALYALAAREQKTPYITSSIFGTSLLVLVTIGASLASEHLFPPESRWRHLIGVVASSLMGIAILNVLYSIWTVRHRKLNFRDDEMLKSLRVIRGAKAIWRRFRPATYEHDPIGLGPLLQSIRELPSLKGESFERAIERGSGVDDKLALSLSVACRVLTHAQSDHLLTELCLPFLREGCWIQYVACGRHPIEFVLQLKKACTKASLVFRKHADRIVAIDAYSPHFGFTDSIHAEMRSRVKGLSVRCETADASYPSLHGAAARSFNYIQRRQRAQGDNVRLPTLLIYDEPYAITDVESIEQYRIFVRHLIPSERLWGGMLTVVVESAISDEALRLLAAYVDVFLDLTLPDEGARSERL